MKRVITIATASTAAVLLALSVSVGAQDFNTQERTFLTFSNAVEMPGMTLPAGTYTFRLADTPSRNVVQVLSQDEKQVHGQFLFVPAERQQVTGETVISFREQKEGTTPAIQYWYYPGEKIGKEFIYPREQALKIAQRTGATVRTEDGPVTANSTASSTDAKGDVTQWKRESTTAAASDAAVQGASGIADNSNSNNNNDQAVASNTQPAPSAPAAVAVDHSSDNNNRPVGTSGVQAESTQARNELPHTASPLLLSGLLGMFSLFGAAGLRLFRA